VSVDFYNTGDLFAVTETLNGIKGARYAAMKAAAEKVSAPEAGN
jgi:hypothetical protein